MLRSLKALHGYTVLAKDGDIGKVSDFYFHDDTWTIRYLVVDTGHWLPGRKVLIAPSALGTTNWAGSNFPVALTKKQVEKSPDIDMDKPVSRQQEVDLYNYYGWPMSWLGPGPGGTPLFVPSTRTPVAAKSSGTKEKMADTHLRSVREVTGYHIHASDGQMGYVGDFIVDDARWIIRYMVGDTSKWLSAKEVLISPQWLGEIRHDEKTVNVTRTNENIMHCPEFHPGELVNRKYEENLYDYYGQPGYWEETGDITNATR